MPSLAIVIPAYNEQDRLGKTLMSIAEAWQSGSLGGVSLEQVIVADDGSNDGTADVAESFLSTLPILLIRLPVNRGKGAAVRAGIGKVTTDLVLVYDADGAAPIGQVTKLFTAIENGADIAIGSRVLGHGEGLVTMRLHRRIIGRMYHGLCSALVPGIRDTACGCKLFRKDVAQELFRLQTIDRFAFDVEVLAIALRLKYRIAEIPLSWTAIPESKVRLVRDGMQMFWCLITLYVRKPR